MEFCDLLQSAVYYPRVIEDFYTDIREQNKTINQLISMGQAGAEQLATLGDLNKLHKQTRGYRRAWKSKLTEQRRNMILHFQNFAKVLKSKVLC